MSNSEMECPDAPAIPGRRGFIHKAGAGVVALGATAATAVSTVVEAADMPRKARAKGIDYDVIVLGGGFAGVTAARDSAKNGYRTLLLEARDRLGGRTWTSEFAGHKIEYGGTWVHWTQPNVWSEILRYGVKVTETPEGKLEGAATSFHVLVDGRVEVLETDEQLVQIAKAFMAYFAEAKHVWERPYDMANSWKEILARDGLNLPDTIGRANLSLVQRVVVESYLTAVVSGMPKDASYVELCRWWALPGGTMSLFSDSLGRYRITDGTISLINKMIDDGKPEVRLLSPVKSVDDRGTHVVVTMLDGKRHTAATVIVALPMNVLPNVEFSPALDPRVIAAGKERHAGGNGIKLFIKVKGRIGKGKAIGMAPATHPLPIVTTYALAEDHSLLIVFAPDQTRINYADKMEVQSALRDFFPDVEVEDVTFNAWAGDPNSLGTWCNYRPGWFGKYVEAFGKDRGRIYFGQGDHGEGWRGFIDGAIGGGAAAAVRVKQLLG